MEYFRLHPWDVSTKEAREIQLRLRDRLIMGQPLKNIRKVAAADVSFAGDMLYGVVAVFSYPGLELIEKKVAKGRAKFPYVPTFLTFREGPILIKAFSKIKNEPDVILFDGQGAAHPLRMGEACHLGILLDRPSIGCAKSRLFGLYKEPKQKKGSYSNLFADGGIVGVALRTRDNTRPIFVSPGFKIDLKSSIEIVLGCTTKYRIPDPLRFVHTESVACAKKN